MKTLKISSLVAKLKPTKPTQETIAPELFNQMLATCSTRAEKKALYTQANSLRQDIVVLSVQRNKDEVFHESRKCSTPNEFSDYIQSLLGTFVNYSEKNSPEKITLLKISDKELIPPDKNTMTAISEKLSWM